jgi:hypothetical protein
VFFSISIKEQSMKKILSISLYLIIIFMMAVPQVSAIPAFARKYNMSCKTCHSPFPYLKEYGEEFAGNGFVLSDQEAPRYFVETGDPELSLLRDVPLAFRLDGYVTYNDDQRKEADFSTPVVFKLLTGGIITKDVSYYLYYILEHGERGKIEDAWLMFNDLFGSDIDVTVGQFQVSDPLFKRELRLTREDYQIYKVRTGFSNIDLTYDRGIMLGYGLPTGTDLVLEIVNGSGIGEGIGSRFDNDEFKNVLGRVSQGIGEHFRIGAMAYWGKERNQRLNDNINEVLFLGGDATINLSMFELNLQYIHRKDKNPFFTGRNISIDVFDLEVQGGFAELIFRPMGDDSKWYAAGLFNWIDTENNHIAGVNYKAVSGHFGYLLSRNFRLVSELTYDTDNEYAKIGLGFVTAF